MQKRFLTVEEAGVILGGEDRPLSPSTIRRLIVAGRIRTTGDTRKLKRIIAAGLRCYYCGWSAPENAPEIPLQNPLTNVCMYV